MSTLERAGREMKLVKTRDEANKNESLWALPPDESVSETIWPEGED